MRRPLTKAVEFTCYAAGFMASFEVDGMSVVDVFFDECKLIKTPQGERAACFTMGGDIVMIESSQLFDLFCEFRKQDEAPEVLTVDGADSSPQCSKCGCDLIHPDGPLCMPCDISGGAA